MIHHDYSYLLKRKEHIHLYENKTIDSEFLVESVMVTGAGGSIGSAIVNRLAQGNLDTIYAVGHGEDSIFQLINSPESKNWNCQVVPVIADAGSETVLSLIRSKLVSYVFHAAAHKHVGLMETNVAAAFENNVQQTLRIAEACHGAGIKFVFVSTDKAVNPTTVMGASKRIAEAGVGAFYPDNTVVCRFGNVLGSAGSIIEIARNKKLRKEKLTIYNGMKRYFITVKEAVGLVLTSAPLRGTYLLDMGEPVDVFDLVKRFGFPESLIERADTPIGHEKPSEHLTDDSEEIQTGHPPGLCGIFSRKYPNLVRAVIEEAEKNLDSVTLIDLANRV